MVEKILTVHEKTLICINLATPKWPKYVTLLHNQNQKDKTKTDYLSVSKPMYRAYQLGRKQTRVCDTQIQSNRHPTQPDLNPPNE